MYQILTKCTSYFCHLLLVFSPPQPLPNSVVSSSSSTRYSSRRRVQNPPYVANTVCKSASAEMHFMNLAEAIRNTQLKSSPSYGALLVSSILKATKTKTVSTQEKSLHQKVAYARIVCLAAQNTEFACHTGAEHLVIQLTREIWQHTHYCIYQNS
jgi:hypothetical protein